MGTTSNCSVLAITAMPDDRVSTLDLQLMLDEIDRRPDCRATLWYLRRQRDQSPAPGTKVVDSLRTWSPAAIADFIGLTGPAAHARGALLRLWLMKVRPDIVLLDDGVGLRVLDPLRTPPRLVVRFNAHLPDTVHVIEDDQMEAIFDGSPDLTILNGVSAPLAGPTDGRFVREYRFPTQAPRAFQSAKRRNGRRKDLGLPEDAPLVVGFGNEGWLDGPDLFLRALWSLRARHGVSAHGVWFGLTADIDERDRLARDAARMGIGDSFHIRPSGEPANRLCGDVAFFSHRSDSEPGDAEAILLSGSGVVAFEATGLTDPAVRLVPDIDVEAAAESIAELLSEDRQVRELDTRRRLDRSLLVDEILKLRYH